jgi:hypothetical protein
MGTNARINRGSPESRNLRISKPCFSLETLYGNDFRLFWGNQSYLNRKRRIACFAKNPSKKLDKSGIRKVQYFFIFL